MRLRPVPGRRPRHALNRYPPKYGVSYAGRESYQANYEDFIRHEIAQAISPAGAVATIEAAL